MEDSRFHVFLSHNSNDKPAVEELAKQLQREGIDAWLDKWHLVPGEAWQPAIERALSECDTCAVFIGPSGFGTWQNEEMRAAISRRVSQSKGKFRVIPVLLPGGIKDSLDELPSFLTATTWVEFRESLDETEAFHRLRSGIRGIAPYTAPGESTFEGSCPYRGLRSFQTEHASLFFGRQAWTDRMVQKLSGYLADSQAARFLAVSGASGSGKSSIVRAGLIPAIETGRISGSSSWPILVCRPGRSPLESLAIAIAVNENLKNEVDSVANTMDGLLNDSRTLHHLIRQHSHSRSDSYHVVIVVDQFEEIFTQCEDPEHRQAFVDNLLHAAESPDGRAIVVLCLRADFYGNCADYPNLAMLLSDHQELVSPMSPHELREVIERPAQLAGCELEPGLVELLLQDMRNQAGALPLLEHALLELWERRQGRRLTVHTYKEIGELDGALRRQADEWFGKLSIDEQGVCRQILLRLTQPTSDGQYARNRVAREQFNAGTTTGDVLQKLLDARLVVAERLTSTSGEGYVEIAHEALITSWPLLRDWIDDDREAWRKQFRLAEAAKEWGEERRNSLLLTGSQLSAAVQLLKGLGDDGANIEKEFVRESLNLDARKQAIEEKQQREKIELLERLAEESEQRRSIQATATALLRRRTQQVSLFLLLAGLVGGGFGFGLLYYRSLQLIELAALSAAEQQAETLRGVHLFYGEEMERIKNLYPDETAQQIIREMLPPATFHIELNDRISRTGTSSMNMMQAQLYSRYPFPGRQHQIEDDTFAKEALAALESDADRTSFYRFEDDATTGYRLRYATPEIMRQSCVTCHNANEKSPKTDWQVNDVGGVLEVSRNLDDDALKSRRALLSSFFAMSIVSVALIGLSVAVFFLDNRIRAR
ncbi:MAG: TIR domain-containing protein [Planctomycetes bacterium]|nr:TIR domain-containing protein [Planctomycetota bacterium]